MTGVIVGYDLSDLNNEEPGRVHEDYGGFRGVHQCGELNHHSLKD